MPTPPSPLVSASCLLLSLGFGAGVATTSCSPEQRQIIRSADNIVRTACDFQEVLPPEAKEVCVTEEELRKALRDIVSTRKVAGSAPGAKGTLVVKVP